DGAVVVGWHRVGHGADGGEAARRGRGRSGDDVFLVLLTGLAQVRVDVDEAGADPQVAHVDDPGVTPDGRRQARLDARDLAILKQHVRLRIEAAPRIDDPAAPQTEVRHELD